MSRKTITVPATPLVESDGSFGHFKDTPRVLGESAGSFGHHKDKPEGPTEQIVNGVKYVMPADERKR